MPSRCAMNVVREIQRLNEREAALGVAAGTGASWHDEYRGHPYVFVGNVPFELTEGDLIKVFAQYGEILDIKLVRDEQTGRPKGFAFVGYEDWRSTILAVDNFNGIELLGRTLRVDHKKDYKDLSKEPRRPPRSSKPMTESDEDRELEKQRLLEQETRRLEKQKQRALGISASGSSDEEDTDPSRLLKEKRREEKERKHEERMRELMKLALSQNRDLQQIIAEDARIRKEKKEQKRSAKEQAKRLKKEQKKLRKRAPADLDLLPLDAPVYGQPDDDLADPMAGLIPESASKRRKVDYDQNRPESHSTARSHDPPIKDEPQESRPHLPSIFHGSSEQKAKHEERSSHRSHSRSRSRSRSPHASDRYHHRTDRDSHHSSDRHRGRDAADYGDRSRHRDRGEDRHRERDHRRYDDRDSGYYRDRDRSYDRDRRQ